MVQIRPLKKKSILPRSNYYACRFLAKKKTGLLYAGESYNYGLCWEFDTHSGNGDFDTTLGWIANFSFRFIQTVNHNDVENRNVSHKC